MTSVKVPGEPLRAAQTRVITTPRPSKAQPEPALPPSLPAFTPLDAGPARGSRVAGALRAR